MAEGPTVREQTLLRVFVDLADTLTADFDLIDFLHRLLVHCTGLVGVPAAGLLLKAPEGGVRLLASSSERSDDVELLHLEADSGPCVDAITTGTAVRVPDLATELDRWPLWAPLALEAGFQSVYATPMTLRGDTIGAVNLFGALPHALSEPNLDLVRGLADVATIGILSERAAHRGDEIADQLHAALYSRSIVEQAKGVLSGRATVDVSMDRAFLLLRDHSRRTNTRIEVVSQALIDGTLDPAALIHPGRRSGARSH